MEDQVAALSDLARLLGDALRHERSLDSRYAFFDGNAFPPPLRSVQRASEVHLRLLNRNPQAYYFEVVNKEGYSRARAEAYLLASTAARYLGMKGATDVVAQTSSTTEGLALLANGIRCQPGDVIVGTVHDFYSLQEAWRLRALQDGLVERRTALFGDPQSPRLKDEILDATKRVLAQAPRVLSLTWVHSNTGVKLPLSEIGELVKKANELRPASRRTLLCVDGVHGLGTEDEDFSALGVDFLAAGCHKWLLGPRGTGVVYGSRAAWEQVSATIPDFSTNSGGGAKNTPGGVAAYHDVWALRHAFEFHMNVGRRTISQYIKGLASLLKAGLSQLKGRVEVITPMSPDLSSGFVCVHVPGVDLRTLLHRLSTEHRIYASPSPADAQGRAYLRFATSILNTPEEVHAAVDALRFIVTHPRP